VPRRSGKAVIDMTNIPTEQPDCPHMTKGVCTVCWSLADCRDTLKRIESIIQESDLVSSRIVQSIRLAAVAAVKRSEGVL